MAGAGGEDRPNPYAGPMQIREATEADWPQIYPFFAAIVAAGESYAYPEDLSSADAGVLWMKTPPSRTVVAVEDTTVPGSATAGTVLGSATMGPNRPGRGSHIATGSFMVDPAHAGRGVGRELGSYLIDWCRSSGYHGIQFNAVVETNRGAVHLWQSLGFEILATVPDAFRSRAHGLVGLHVMYLPLGR